MFYQIFLASRLQPSLKKPKFDITFIVVRRSALLLFQRMSLVIFNTSIDGRDQKTEGKISGILLYFPGCSNGNYWTEVWSKAVYYHVLPLTKPQLLQPWRASLKCCDILYRPGTYSLHQPLLIVQIIRRREALTSGYCDRSAVHAELKSAALHCINKFARQKNKRYICSFQSSLIH